MSRPNAIIIELSEDEKANLRQIARENERTMAAMIRWWIRQESRKLVKKAESTDRVAA